MGSTYNQVRDKILTGDLLLYSGTSPVALIIQAISKSPWNHVAAGLSLTEYGIRKCCVESVAYGPDISYISDELDGYRGRIAWAPLRPEYSDLRHNMGKWLFDKEAHNVKYDYKTLIKNIVGYVSTDFRRYICSGLVFAMGVDQALPVPDRWNDKTDPAKYIIPRPGDMLSLGWWMPPIILT